MKALIVDDEKHVRNSIRVLVDWEKFGIDRVLEAENGAQAIEIIRKEQPHLVITDMMMPCMNGVELMEWMVTQTPECKKIVISGHNDFDFARQTIKYGGIDYLLKPIDKKQLDDAIRSAIDQWNKSNHDKKQLHDRNMEVNALKPLYRDKLLSEWLMNVNLSANQKNDLYHDFPHLIHSNAISVAIVRLDVIERIIHEKYVSSMDLLLFTLINISNERLDPASSGIAFRHWYSPNEMVIIMSANDEEADSLLKQIDRDISQILYTHFYIGVCSLSSSSAFKVQDAYKKAAQALRQRNLMDRNTYIHIFKAETAPRLFTLRFYEFEENIRLSILSGNRKQIEAASESWIEAIRNMGAITIGQLELWWDEYIVMKVRWVEELLEEYEGVHPFPFESSALVVPLDETGEFSLPAFHQELVKDLTQISEFLLARQKKSHNVMKKIAQYIEKNYDQDISLQDISEQFHLNSEHISRKFKQDFNENIVRFHNRIRIEKAKILLQNPKIKIADVSQMVGFQDDKYFSRVFKKFINQTPKEYRNQSEVLR